MAEKDINNHIFDKDDSTLDLDVKTEIRFSKKNLPRGEMVPVFADGKKEYVLIPPDIKDGTVLTVSGGGKHNPRSGKTGDLHVLVHLVEERQSSWKTVSLVAAIAVVALVAFLMRNKPVSVSESVQNDAISVTEGTYLEIEASEEPEEAEKSVLLNQASELAQNKNYRQAIQLMDDAWKQYGYQEYYDAAAEYRKEFGIHNGSYIAAGKYNTIMIQGTDAVVCGDDDYNELNAKKWTSIVAVSAGDRHVVGLRANGTVLAEGDNKYGECDVGHWNNIVAVCAGDCHTVVLKENGMIDAVGFEDGYRIDKIMSAAGDRKIVSIAAGLRHTLALLEDGTVVSGGKPIFEREADVSGWTDIAAICAGSRFSAGLKTDGTVVVCGSDTTGNIDISRDWDLSLWTDIVALAAGDYYLVGLRADGTVVKAGYIVNDTVEKEHAIMKSWRDIVYVAAGHNHTVAITKNGKILCAGSNGSGQCDFNGKEILYP